MKLLSSKPGALLLKTLWLYLGLSLLLLLIPSARLQPLRSIVLRPFGLVQRALFAGSAPIERFPERLSSMWDEAGRERKLQNEVDRLKAQLARERELRLAAETRLRQMDALPPELRMLSVTARVAAYDSSPARSSVLLDRGSNDGVRRGAGVLCNGALAGRIASPVDSHNARALLLADPGCRVMVRCERSRVMGVLEGAGGGRCIVKYVPLEADVRPGDLFITSGLNDPAASALGLPDGLLAGFCTEATREPGETTMRVVLRPAVDASQLEQVAVIVEPPAREARR